MLDLDMIGVIFGATLTIFVLSYLVGDNFLYRLALHIFLGALVGYAFGLTIREVWGKLIADPWREDLSRNLALIIPVGIGLGLFVFKSVPRFAYIGNFFLSPLIGFGIAIALVGALVGTLAPQFTAAASAMSTDDPLQLLQGVIITGGTICTLLAFDFTFTQKRRGLGGLLGKIIGIAGSVGRVFLTIAFGVAFAGAITAALSIFIGRIQYLIEAIQYLLEAPTKLL
jgi:hypothetical protein